MVAKMGKYMNYVVCKYDDQNLIGELLTKYLGIATEQISRCVSVYEGLLLFHISDIERATIRNHRQFECIFVDEELAGFIMGEDGSVGPRYATTLGSTAPQEHFSQVLKVVYMNKRENS